MISIHNKIIQYTGDNGQVRLSKCTKCGVDFKPYEEIYVKRGKRVKRFCLVCAAKHNMI